MNKRIVRAVALVATVAMLTAGCGKKPQTMDGTSAVKTLMESANFDTPLSPKGEDGALYFPNLPEGSTVVRHGGSGYYADEIVLITLKNEADRPDAVRAVERHIEELRVQFMNYVPEELDKIENAIIFETGNQIVLCITNDYDRAGEILKGEKVPDTDGTKEENTTAAATTAATTEPTETTAEPTAAPTEPTETTAATEPTYPVITSQSGTYHDYGNNAIRVDNSAFELYGYISGAAGTYTGLVSKVADSLQGQTTVYDLAIPTAVGVVLPDDIAEILPSFVNQGEVIEKIYSQLSPNVVPVRCFDNMMQHRDEYLYFHTDYHWNGRGAYYAYESFCHTKGIDPIPLEERELKTFDGFIGLLYSQTSGKDPLLKENPDTVEAFLPKSQSATMQYTDRNGQTVNWQIIADVSQWGAGSKYNTFAGSDNPFSVFTNPEVTDGSVCVIVKESYGNALLPYLVDHYSTIYEIDYRYWDGDLAQFAREKNANDLIFANNLTMISTNLLVGMLADNVH